MHAYQNTDLLLVPIKSSQKLNIKMNEAIRRAALRIGALVGTTVRKRQNELSWEAVCSKLLIRGPATFGNLILVFTGLQEITIQEYPARSEIESYKTCLCGKY